MEWGALAGIVAVYCAVVLGHSDVVPMWDARIYYDQCLVPAVTDGFHLGQLNCFKHPSAAYMTLVALPQMILPGNVFLVHMVNMVLGVLGLLAFHGAVRSLFTDRRGKWERLAMVSCLAFSPLYISSSLNINPDFGVITFGLITLALALSRVFRAVPIAGMFMVFSKEFGIVLYGVGIAIYAIVFVTRNQGSVRGKVLFLLRRSWIAIPVFVFLVHLLVALFTSDQAAVWSPSPGTGKDQAMKGMLDAFTGFSLLDPVFLNYCRGILVLNFNWLYALPVAAFILFKLVCWLFAIEWPTRDLSEDGSQRKRLFTLAMFFVSFLLLTRYRTYSNVRYFLPLLPLLLLSYGWVLGDFVSSRIIRLAIIGFAAVGALLSNIQMIDPVTKAAYGTWKFGNHDMLWVTDLTGECCGYGRDQLQYNLEFTKFHDALNVVFKEIQLDENTRLVGHADEDWYLLGRVDKATRERTLSFDNVFEPELIPVAAIYTKKVEPPKEMYYLALPNFRHEERLRFLSTLYEIEWAKAVGTSGYMIDVYKMRLKGTQAKKEMP